ncbi:MAG: ABC transporter permease [Candidatus Woesearchaeota archaeon]
MIKLLAIIKKNLRQLIHSKLSSLIIVLGPIIIIALAGVMLSGTGLQGINVGIYLIEDCELAGKLEEELSKNSFAVFYYDTLEQCKQGVISGDNHICVEIADKGKKDLANIDPRLKYKVNFYVDYSRVRLVWAIINAIRSIVAEESSMISAEFTGKAATAVDEGFSQLETQQDTIDDVIVMSNDVKDEIGRAAGRAGEIDSGLSEVRGFLNSGFDALQSKSNEAVEQMSDASVKFNDVVAFLPPEAAAAQYAFSSSYNTAFSTVRDVDKNLVLLQGKAERAESSLDAVSSTGTSIQSGLFGVSNSIGSVKLKLTNVKAEMAKASKDYGWVKGVNADDIMTPIPIEIMPVTGEVEGIGSVSNALTYLDYLFPALTIIVIMFVATILASTMTMKERKCSAYFRNIISPTSSFLLAIGNYFTGLILVCLQVALLFTVAAVFFNASLIQGAYSIAAILFLVISFFLFLGIVIGYIFNSEETAIVGSVSAAIVFLIFSALIIPVETMPSIMGMVTRFSPFVVAETALRQVIIFGADFRSLYKPLAILGCYVIATFALAFIVQKIRKTKEI